MGMTEKDGCDLPMGRSRDILEVTVIVRIGLKHDKAVIGLNEVGVGAVAGHQAAIVSDDPGDAWHDRQGHAACGLWFGEKRYLANTRLELGRM